MTKNALQTLIVECLRDYATDNAPQPVKENRMTLKKSELKAIVNEVVRQCVSEAGPQYKVRGKQSQLEQPGIRNKAREIQSDPEINEGGPQYKVRGKQSQLEQPGIRNKAREIQGDPEINEEFAPGDENAGEDIDQSGGGEAPWATAWAGKDKGAEHGGEDEQEEIRLLKGLAMIALKLLKMHQGTEEPEGEESGEPAGDDVPFKGPESGDEASEEPAAPEASDSPKEDEDEIDENHQVQARSFKTVKDAEGNHPERIRKASIPH